MKQSLRLNPGSHREAKSRHPCALFLWIALLALTIVGPLRMSAQPAMQTILTNGTVSNRLNVVVLSEGYMAGQLSGFLVDATNSVNALLAHQPFVEYQGYFNAFAIKVASSQSGSDHPSYPLFRNTYFNSSYDATSDLLIVIPPGSQGQGKVDALLQTFMPQAHLSILLVNDPAFGGSDGFDRTAISYAGASSPEILTHETGHVLANLGDEYSYSYPGFPDTEEPNTTRETRRDFIKWKAWISTNTPIPTPPTEPYSGDVGLFEGAHYHATNWYRPQLNCAMRSQGVPFCAVCTEALVLAIYRKVRPIDGFVPASTNLSVTNLSVSTPPPLPFGLTVLQPATHSLSVQWFTNGTALNGATNLTLSLPPQSLGNGSHLISVTVRDDTPLVRNDPSNLLIQTINWTVHVKLPQLRLDSPIWLAGGKFAFRVTGNVPQGIILESSTNLSTWTSLTTNTLVNGQIWHTNSGGGNLRQKFFRARTLH